MKAFEPSFTNQITLFEAIAISILTAMAYITMTTEHLQNDLRRQAQIDPLTGCYNRRAFYAIADHSLSRSKRDREITSFIMLDLDHFKAINDTHGHLTGDEVLKHVVDIVADVKREQDTLSRYGGEEFIIMLPNTPSREAAAVAERIRRSVEQSPVEIDGITIKSTISLGIAATDLENIDNSNVGTLISKADRALYNAKKRGRNRVEQ
ncbi:GGDEF domain-containing protein [Candidatus Reidiella endopervernicosa]|uniref:diguanylate cyclase n=1 Tax=Candidatus Reidiella endopervernicosa TaxID=2738883 RepID=A0A6N0HTF2_9GAMM|nr:GGDEF domain-containing protein [Candidatus Reidiella endopervernicosa]QKQ25649.1 GGDEF domain-containing protein [Candidatus Reidiella endopervernicosa]